jgi:hypothetical protein
MIKREQQESDEVGSMLNDGEVISLRAAISLTSA